MAFHPSLATVRPSLVRPHALLRPETSAGPLPDFPSRTAASSGVGSSGALIRPGYRPMRHWFYRAFLLLVLSLATTSAALVDPALYRATLRLEPSTAQLQTLPDFPARWYLSAATAASLPRLLADHHVTAGLAAELAARARPLAGTADWEIVPDRALLARFTPAERATWQQLLCRHPGNETYRWPLSLGPEEWRTIAATPAWAEAAARIRAHAQPAGDRLIFGDLFALEDAFASPADRSAFYGLALGGDMLVLKLSRPPGATPPVEAQTAWWQVAGRHRAIEPMLNATLSLPNGPRLDVAHLLPRLARSLLNTFPPALDQADDAGVESSVMASDFFALAPGADPRTEGTFHTWLTAEAVPVDGPPQYGDLLVYGDLANSPWPYTVVYIADQVGFARRPTAFGPWQFIALADIGRLNPRFTGQVPRVFRNKAALVPPGAPPFLPQRLPEAWHQQLKLRQVRPGPWGRLWYFDVLLAPASDTLQRLPAPDPHPRWVFEGVTREQLLALVESSTAPGEVRSSLQALFAQATADASGRITVEPSLPLVLAVPASFRTEAFPHLVGGLSVADYAQHIPFPRGFTVDEWFDAGSLPETVRQAILRLVYPAGNRMMLSDFGALYGLLDTRAEQLSAHRAALRTAALVVLLERPSPAEAAAVARYWTYSRNKSVARLIESFAADPRQRFLDIVHLLAPVERELINTYFNPAGPEPTPSCFWTAFNFGVNRPDDRFLVQPGVWTEHRELAWRELAEKFDPIAAPERVGDIIAYRRKGEAACEHVCVYLADDLVFTKNGFTFSSPWYIAHLDELDEQYLARPDLERVYFRRRPAPAP